MLFYYLKIVEATHTQPHFLRGQKMAIRSRELGKLIVDCGDVVCFSVDNVIKLAEQHGFAVEKVDEFIKKWGGVECDLRSNGVCGVDQVTAVNQNGSTYNAIIIGADMTEIKRFLLTSEEEFSEFYATHPKAEKIGKGKNFNHGVFAEIHDEYKGAIMRNLTDIQAEPPNLPR